MAFLRQVTEYGETDRDDKVREDDNCPLEEKNTSQFQTILNIDKLKSSRAVKINFRLHVTEKLPPTYRPGIRYVRCTSGMWTMSETVMCNETSKDDTDIWYQTFIDIPQRSEFIWRWTMFEGQKVVDVEKEVRTCKIGRYGGVLHTVWDDDVKILEPDMCVVTFYTCYHTYSDERLALIGSSDALGEWQSSKSVPAYQYPGGSGEWSATVPLERNLDQEWKWIVMDQTRDLIRRWEDGRNREINGDGCDWKVVWAPWNSKDYVTDYGNFDKMELSSLRLPRYLDCYEES
ncbi:hypothetical protein LOTGIDRAFT_165666 [Lottia gigantea]|uniref:CBM20 domain-containing protein n=1 Tax=Lottia gigantea TaxID=225164 RepID=V3ZV32_LOTGI|nr:hypothetical protein LOTGIDRAFT_165666 [Lottia gigantea]ESO88237.1 hypothetical protein LOTGIDRAFT_165666 [Lottia gigantea]